MTPQPDITVDGSTAKVTVRLVLGMLFAMALWPPLVWLAVGARVEGQRVDAAADALAWLVEGSQGTGHVIDAAQSIRLIAQPPFDARSQRRILIGAGNQKIAALGAERALAWPTLATVRDLRPASSAVVRLEVQHSLRPLFVDAGVVALASTMIALGLWTIVFNHKVRALRQAERRLRTLSKRDALTGLLNREGLRITLEHALERQRGARRNVGVLLIDLDRFHLVNNSLGHPAGDELLRSVANRIRTVVRESDLMARLGADQFAIQVEGVSGIQALAVMARNLLRVFESAYQVGGRDMVSSLSIGIVVAGEQVDSVDRLLKCAEVAMRSAKASGGGCYRSFDATMQIDDDQRLDLDRRLRGALKNGEFALVFQPVIDADSRRVAAVEALLRWADPSLVGMVQPAQFIPVLEQTGLIVPVGNWVLREACCQAVRWLADGARGLVISVNVSPRQFAEANFVESVTSILAETGLPANRLQLEVTEGLLLDPTAESLRKIDALVQAGVHLAVDDFGMGYSSLAYLKSLPLHTLKIDRMFVRDMPARQRDAAIVRAIINLGHGLGLQVTAEGVETEEQFDALRALGCDSMQGYLFARPVGAEGMRTILAERGTVETGETAPASWSTTMASMLHTI